MVIEEIVDQLTETLQSRVLAVLGHPAGAISIDRQRDPAKGDLTTNAVAQLARSLHRDAHAAAEAVAERLVMPQLVRSVTAEPNGTLAFRLRRGSFAFELWRRAGGDTADERFMERLTLDDRLDDEIWRQVLAIDESREPDAQRVVGLFR